MGGKVKIYMPPSRNNTVKFTDLQAISSVNLGDIIPVVDTSVPTLVNKKINVQDFSRSLPVSQQVAQIGALSANWNSSYSTTLANSASWSTGGSYGSVYSANSAEYESTYTSVNINSANWNSAYNTVQTSSAAWAGLTTYTTVNSLSNNWNSGFSAYSSLNVLSTGYWLVKAGDQVTGSLTTTKTLTTQFTDLNEFVSKRYVDAAATATQISGNFVPSLYYTKNDFQTGIPASINITPIWNNSTTVFTSLSVGVIDTTSNTNSLLLDLQTNGVSRLKVRKDGLIQGSQNYNTMWVAGLLNSNDGVGATPLNFLNPFSGTIGIAQGASIQWGGPAYSGWAPLNEQGEIILFRDDFGTLGLRSNSTAQYSVDGQALRVYKRYVNNSTNFERFGLSGNRLAYELSGSQRFYINPAPNPSNVNNVALSWNSGSGILTIDPYNGIDWQFARNGSASHILRAGGTFETRVLGAGLSIDTGTGTIGSILFEAADTVGIRNSTNSQNLRVYNTYTDANNYERLSLSATRIAYERAGTGVSRDLTIQSTGNLILSAGGSLSFSQSLPTAFAGLQVNAPASNTSSYFRVLSSNGKTLFNVSSAGRVAIRGRSNSISDSSMESPTYDLECIGFTQPILFRHLGSNTGFIVDEFGHGLNSDVAGCWLGASGTGARLQLWGGGPLNGVAIGSGTTGFLNVYNNGKVAIGRNSIYANTLTSPLCAHVAIVNDNSMDSYTTDILLLSSNSNTPTFSQYFLRCYDGVNNNLSVRRDGLTVIGGGGGLGRVWLYQGPNMSVDIDPTNSTGYIGLAPYMQIGWTTGAANLTRDTNLLRTGAGRLEQRAGATPQSYTLYNTYTDDNNYERLRLSATRIAYEATGTGVSRDLTISTTGNLILSGAGIFLNTATPYSFGTSQLSAYRVQLLKDPATGSLGYIDTPFDGTIMRLGATWDVTTNNYAANNFGRGQINFPGVVNTPNSFALNNQIYLYKDGSLATDLITLSSNVSRVGFSFTSKSPQNGRCVIYNEGDNLILAAYSGAGKRISFRDWDYSTGLGGGVFGEVSYSGWQTINIGITNFTGYTTSDSLRITQITNQTAPYFRAVNSVGSTIFQINSANNVVVSNLLALGGTTSSNAAIKASGTTVVAKLGDDSDYAYLQGKLQTLNTAAAGTFTPDKYLILYDSTGTAYKVPVQAL